MTRYIPKNFTFTSNGNGMSQILPLPRKTLKAALLLLCMYVLEAASSCQVYAGEMLLRCEGDQEITHKCKKKLDFYAKESTAGP
jgi:hypothetical protein